MSDRPSLRYWDSCIFIHIIAGNEPIGNGILKACVKDVELGKIKVVTSAFTLAEVVKTRQSQQSPLKQEDEMKIKEVFKSSIYVYELTRIIAERAREIQWESNSKIKPADSVHLATAEFASVERFETYDEELIKKTNVIKKQFGKQIFIIGFPYKPQIELDI